MQFTKRLHEPIRAGVIRVSIRVWKRMHAKVGGVYCLGTGPGYIVVDSIEKLNAEDLSDELAIESGFDDVQDLMKVAQHGSGKDMYLILFHYVDSYLE